MFYPNDVEALLRTKLTGGMVRVAAADRRVFLTYDDGPEPDVTPQVLKLLKQFEAGATFFVLPSHAEWWEDLIRRIAQEGHTIGLHGMAHESCYWRGNREILEDLLLLEKMIGAAGARCARIFRPPFGDVRPDTVRFLRKRGFGTVLWSCMPGDFKPLPIEKLLHRAVRGMRSGSILALHDGTKLRPAPVVKLTERLLNALTVGGWKAASLQEGDCR
jgi:peptidoglycan/xylan/chitin deacetylase (PgdA/CDA1 family)